MILEVTPDYKITDEQNNLVSLEQAKQLTLDGKVTNCNISFQRLVSYDFDIEQLKQFYNET